MIQPDYIEIEGAIVMPPRTNFPRGYMAGPTDPLSSAATDPLAQAISDSINKMLQGGPAGSPERKDRTEFFSDILSLTGQKFVASPKGKEALDNVQSSFLKASIPLLVIGLAVGYFIGSRK